MANRISVDASGRIARGVLTTDAGRSHAARAGIVPLEPAAGTLSCLGKLAADAGTSLTGLLQRTETILIRTGLAEEVLARRAGAKIGTIATRGFRTRFAFRPVPCDEPDSGPPGPRVPLSVLADGHLMTEVAERVSAHGAVITPLDEESVAAAMQHLKKEQVGSIAVLFLFSPLHPQHEERVGEIIADEFPGAHVLLSSRVGSSLGESERWNTTLLSAYLAPAVSGYVADLDTGLSGCGFGGQLLLSGSSQEPAAAAAVVENPALLLAHQQPTPDQPAAPLRLPRGFQDILTVDTGETSYCLGFHPGREAKEGCDGSPGIGFVVATADSVWTDVELSETHCPVVVNELRLLEDGEGAGEFRGAPGVSIEVTLRAPLMVTAEGCDDELLLCVPEGVCRPMTQGSPQPAQPGDRCVARCLGSAGWGNPLDRSVAKVQQDVIAGYVSVARAREVYGVVLNPSTLELQCDATVRLREARRAETPEIRGSRITRRTAGP